MSNGAAGSESGVVLQVTCSDFGESIRELGRRNIDTATGVVLCALSHARLNIDFGEFTISIDHIIAGYGHAVTLVGRRPLRHILACWCPELRSWFVVEGLQIDVCHCI